MSRGTGLFVFLAPEPRPDPLEQLDPDRLRLWDAVGRVFVTC
ncbi:hypothetical protein [Streptomyces coelicolor A3(2)]|jgi:hypothetical protein|uniref:Uncharacterized protein n=2 Tax=Streptomyces coelicolor TaxID=1902 RepID=Q9AD27_STRCO|nr:hypothetical protein [Streptomyces coelicolor]CAC36644.1 hypothetical protein [Streptomyces coelicolor A3(2)]